MLLFRVLLLGASFAAGVLGQLPGHGRPATRATTAPRVPADVLVPDELRHFTFAIRREGWGPEVDGWWMAASALVAEIPYVEGGALEEVIRPGVTLFTKDGDYQRWSKVKSLRVTWTLQAEGLAPFVRSDTIVVRAGAWNTSGSEWHVDSEISLRELRDRWVVLPTVLTIHAALVEPELPQVASGLAEVRLVARKRFDGCSESRPAGAAAVDWLSDPTGRTQLKKDAEMYGAASRGEVEEVTKAIARGARTLGRIDLENTMIRAAGARHLDKLGDALRRCADVNARLLDLSIMFGSSSNGMTALMMAARAGQADVVEILIASGAALELEDSHRTALQWAAFGGHDRAAELLAKAGAKGDLEAIRSAGQVIRAACQGFTMREGEGFPPFPGMPPGTETVAPLSELLAKGGDVNAADGDGYTALMYAANLGRIDNVRLLLDRGADAALKAHGGATALSLAESTFSSVAKAERLEIVKLLKARLSGPPAPPGGR